MRPNIVRLLWTISSTAFAVLIDTHGNCNFPICCAEFLRCSAGLGEAYDRTAISGSICHDLCCDAMTIGHETSNHSPPGFQHDGACEPDIAPTRVADMFIESCYESKPCCWGLQDSALFHRCQPRAPEQALVRAEAHAINGTVLSATWSRRWC
jgi:hypothetical protein